MANTRDEIGEQATVDALVKDTLESFEENGITTLPAYGLARKKGLKSVKLPNLTSVSSYAFGYCENLETVDLPVAAGTSATYGFRNCAKLREVKLGGNGGQIHANTFNSCSKLELLQLQSNTKLTLANANAFNGTPIGNNRGGVFVPTALVDTYKADSMWKKYRICDISKYPVWLNEISDSWATIVTNPDYATDYHIGDVKPISINGTQYLAEIVAFNKDVKTGGGTAGITWLLFDIMQNHAMNSQSSTVGGWEASGMRSWINSDILPNLDIKDHIVEVSKISDTYENGAVVHNGQTTHDKLWIPSAQEIFGGSSYETEGVAYSDRFTAEGNRIKYINGSANSWWLRSAYSSTYFWYVNSYGGASGGYASYSYGVVLGFCTN